MEIDVTPLLEKELMRFSSSIVESGDENIAVKTWNAAIEQAETLKLLNQGAINAFKKYVKEFGAWDAEEIASWTDIECNALFIQLVSGDLREALDLFPAKNGYGINWREYEKERREGTVEGSLFYVARRKQVYYSF